MSYFLIIAASLVLIFSSFFNFISRKTKIPSVLLLIILGGILNFIKKFTHYANYDFFPILEILGIVGLIMIVLEASLELKLTKSKLPLLLRSFFIALFGVAINMYLIALAIQSFYDVELLKSLIYATPLSIISSAIVIPSIASLETNQKEALIYESTFSDIFGIIAFYTLLEISNFDAPSQIGINLTGNISVTVFVSIILSYMLIFVFQKIQSQAKLFLLIAILLLLYSIGKLFHFSSLIMILIFGLILNNRELFFFGFLKKYLNKEKAKEIYKDFNMLTIESSFVIRSFFFVFFGMSLSLASIINIKVFFISILVLLIIFGIRFLFFKISNKHNILPMAFIAPRGLISILLFFTIPQEYAFQEFESGVLLFVIIVSSIVMAIALIKRKKEILPESVTSQRDISRQNTIEQIKKDKSE